MNVFDILTGFGIGGKLSGSGAGVRYGVILDQLPDKEPEPENLSTIFTCTKILSDNFSKLPIKLKKGFEDVTDHPIIDRLEYRPSDTVNKQVFYSTLEWHRNTTGNAFVWLKNWVIFDSIYNTDWKYEKGKLYYKFDFSLDVKQLTGFTGTKWIPATELLHFRQMSNNGVIGLSPISASQADNKILQNASATINSFYRNKAMSTMAIESVANTVSMFKVIQEDNEAFSKQYAGVSNAGRPITLPVNTKLTPLAVKFADAELISTMKFSRSTIANMYGVPDWMINTLDSNMDIEQLTSQFKTMTMSPIVEIYAQELMFKLLTLEEIKQGYRIEFDLDALVEVSLSNKVVTLKEASNNALMTKNEARNRLKLPPKEGGDKLVTQIQYQPINTPLNNNAEISTKQHPETSQGN